MRLKDSEERDFVGYGDHPPLVEWPGGARVAVSLCLNYEEGAELSLALGDPVDETFSEWGETARHIPKNERRRSDESFTEYGSRAGVWRLLDILTRHNVKATFFACAQAFERNPEVARAVVERGHEVCGHGYRWENHFGMSEQAEQERIQVAIRSFERTTGVRPYGWFQRDGFTANTRRLLVEAGFIYDSNAFSDDLPYFVRVGDRPHLIIPYGGDLNDVRFWISPGYATADDFYTVMKDSLDCLLLDPVPRMMSVGLHMRICGRPSRAPAVDRFLSYALSKGQVWITRRDEIARWWLQHGPKPELV